MRDIITLVEGASHYFDPNAIYLHGGPAKLNGNVLKRYMKSGGDMGGLFFVKDTPNDRKYAITYTYHHQESAVYKVRINLTQDQVFDLSNSRHLAQLRKTFNKSEVDWFIESSRGGALDWAAMPDEDQMMEIGFRGMVLVERPPNFDGNSDYIYSICIFDANDCQIVGKLSDEEIRKIQ